MLTLLLASHGGRARSHGILVDVAAARVYDDVEWLWRRANGELGLVSDSKMLKRHFVGSAGAQVGELDGHISSDWDRDGAGCRSTSKGCCDGNKKLHG